MTEQQSIDRTSKTDAEMASTADGHAPKKRNWWRHLAGIIATFVIIAAIFILLPLSPSSTPEQALHSAWKAIENKNVEMFKASVNLERFVESMMEQAIVYEETRQSHEDASTEDVRRLMRAGVIGAFRHDISKTYSEQILSLVQTGQLPESNQGLLTKIWTETGAQQNHFKKVQITDQHENSALATLTFTRPDLKNKNLVLNILLEKSALDKHQAWVVSGMPNLAGFLLEIDATREHMLKTLNQPIQKELEQAITFLDIQKFDGLNKQTPGVMWRMAYMNTSGRDIESFTIQQKVYDVDGTLLSSETFHEKDPLPKGAAAEKAWPMPLSTSDKKQRKLLESDLRTLRLETKITHLTFSEGDALKLYKTLPQSYDFETISEKQRPY